MRRLYWRSIAPLGYALTILGHACAWAAEKLQDASHHLIRCPDCGRSRYYGSPCVAPHPSQRPRSSEAR